MNLHSGFLCTHQACCRLRRLRQQQRLGWTLTAAEVRIQILTSTNSFEGYRSSPGWTMWVHPICYQTCYVMLAYFWLSWLYCQLILQPIKHLQYRQRKFSNQQQLYLVSKIFCHLRLDQKLDFKTCIQWPELQSCRTTWWPASTRCTRTWGWRAGKACEETPITLPPPTRAVETQRTQKSQIIGSRRGSKSGSPSPSRRVWRWRESRKGKMPAGWNLRRPPRCLGLSTTFTPHRLLIYITCIIDGKHFS